MTRWILISGGVFSGLAVLIGAFGAHALKAILEPSALGWIETGVEYQVTHALALIACGLLPSSRASTRTAILFILGIVFFSGSLYLMALSDVRALGVITPIGGVFFVFAWISFCLSVRDKTTPTT